MKFIYEKNTRNMSHYNITTMFPSIYRTVNLPRKLISSISLPFSSTRVSPFVPKNTPRRAQQSLFLGRYKDELTKSNASIENKEDFVSETFSLMKSFEELPAHSPFWLDSTFQFNGPHSHIHEHYVNILSMCYEKSKYMEDPKTYDTSNHSGYYFVGPRGVGKSMMMQSCCVASSQMLPNFVSLYLCAKSVKPHDLKYYLAELINEHVDDDSQLPTDSSIQHVLAKALKSNISIGIFLDEAESRFSRENDWSDLHACLTGYNCAVFLSGSEELLTPMVRLNDDDRRYLEEVNKLKAGRDVDTLNVTKLLQAVVQGFTSPEQYRLFFKSRQSLLNVVFPDIVNDELCLDDIKLLHIITAGRLRAMHKWRTLQSNPSQLFFGSSFHTITLEERKVLGQFFKEVKGDFDPFNLPSLPIQFSSMGESETSRDTMLFYDAAFQMTRRRLLVFRGIDSVTIATPILYLVRGKIFPTVFISHAEGEYNSIKNEVEYLHKALPINLVCSSHHETRAALSKAVSVQSFEDKMISNSQHIVILAASKLYCEKVDKGDDCGSVREWELIEKYFKDDKDRFIFAYSGSCNENVFGRVKNFLSFGNKETKPLLKFGHAVGGRDILLRIIRKRFIGDTNLNLTQNEE